MRIQTYSFETDTSEIILSFVTVQRTTIALFDNKKILQVRLKINWGFPVHASLIDLSLSIKWQG